MRILKWVIIVAVIMAALVLIVPAFLPSEATISAETEIAVSPEQVFHSAALFNKRHQWDPWLILEPEANVTIVPNPAYVGSTYSWDGEKIGSGKMRVDSVVYGKMIRSSIWFGEETEPSTVIWYLAEQVEGTHVTWSFTAEGKYPLGRLMLRLMVDSMEKSFESGLTNFREMLEANPPVLPVAVPTDTISVSLN